MRSNTKACRLDSFIRSTSALSLIVAATAFSAHAAATSILIQAENYTVMSGIQTEVTNDIGGGSNVGYIDAGDWMTYPVNIPTTGKYKVTYRVASLNGGGMIKLEKAGGAPLYGTRSVPVTGGWQKWEDVSHEVDLTAGQQDIAIAAGAGGFNVNWFKIESVSNSSVSSSVKSSLASSSTSSTIGGGVLFQENFEAGAVNSQPSGWENFIGWVPNNSNTLGGAQYALIDNNKSYNGSNSIHFKGGAAPAQIIRALPAGTQRLYTRAYVNMSVAMGNVAGDNHEHILGIKKTKDANDEIRVGQIKGVLGTNHIPSDNIAPKMSQWFSGPQMAPNTWHCVEVDYLADQAYDTLKMRVNGTEVHSITSANDWNNGALGADWMSDKFNYVMFGFHSFSNRSADVWMDDIVVSTQPIGCGTVIASSSSAPSSVASSSSSRSSTPSSIASSSVAQSSVVSSSIASSTANSGASSSSANTAAWNLDTTVSYLNFVTTKNTHNMEVHKFNTISGGISADNVATLTIDLSSVNTGIALRDQRMRDLLFEVTNYPTATVTVAVPAALISSLAVGQSATTDISASLNLHGVTGAITTKVSVQKLSANRVLVQSLSPILVKAGDYSLTNGVEALRAVVGIASISVAVPVDFALVFDAR